MKADLSLHTKPPVWRRLAVYGFFVLFAAWCIKAFHQDIVQIDLRPLRAGWLAVLGAAALSLLNYALRVWRWQLYLRRLGYDLPWRFVALTFMAGFAFTLSPGKLGEMVRARYYQPHGITVPQVSAAFFVERLLDLVVMLVLAAAVLTELRDYQTFFWLAVALVVGALVAVAWVPWARLAQQFDGQPQHSRLQSLMAAVVNMLVSAKMFLTPGLLLAGFVLGLVAWGGEAVGLQWVAAEVSALELSLPAAMGIYAIAIIVGALSFLPGGLGSTEAVMTALLYAHGYAMHEAILLTLVCRLLTLWLAVLIGWLCVWLLRGKA